MPIAWFLSPYKSELDRAVPGPRAERSRYCAMDDFSQEIHAVGGDWRESEIDGNQAIVRVRADSVTLASIGLLHRELSETEALSSWTPTRSKPMWDDLSQRIIFQSSKQQPCVTLERLVKDVPDTPPSKELLELIGLWAAVGFGQGWRLPWDVILQGALSGFPPILGAAFPTTSTLDSFGGSDENPIATNWSGPMVVGDGQIQLLSNQVRPNGVSFCDSWYDVTTYGPNSEAFMDVPTMQTIESDYCSVWTNGISPGTSGVDGYAAYYLQNITTPDTRIFYRIDNGSFTTLSNTGSLGALANGDAVGLEVISDTLQAYRKPSAGAWGTYGASVAGGGSFGAGSLVIDSRDTLQTARMDNFGGGTVVTWMEETEWLLGKSIPNEPLVSVF